MRRTLSRRQFLQLAAMAAAAATLGPACTGSPDLPSGHLDPIPAPSVPRSVVVVGGGLAGLTAAYRLTKAGYEVQVLEAAPALGGRVTSFEWHGLSISPGAEFVTAAGDGQLMWLVDDLGIRDRMAPVSEGVGFEHGVIVDGKITPLNFVDAASLLRWDAVPLGARLSLARLVPHVLRYRDTAGYEPEALPQRDDAVSMERFFRDKINSTMWDYWMAPTMSVFCGYGPADLSGSTLLWMLSGYWGSKLSKFLPDMQFLPDAMGAKLDVRLNARVTKVAPSGAGVDVSYVQDGAEETIRADAAVLAVPGDQVLPILTGDVPAAWTDLLAAVRYSNVAILYSWLDADVALPDGGGVMCPEKEGYAITSYGWLRQPEAAGVLANGYWRADHRLLSDDELAERIWKETLRSQPHLEGRVQDQMIYRWDRKVPTYPPGLLARLAAFWKTPGLDNVVLAGDYLSMPMVGGAIASGWRAADAIAARNVR